MLVGATPLFLIHAVTFLVVVFVLAGLPEQETTHSSATNVDVDEEPDSPGALSYISLLRRSNVSLYIAVRSTSCILFCAVLPLYIVKAHEMGLGERGVGLFYATMGVGTLVGSTVAGVGSYMSRRALGISAVASLTGAGFLTGFGLAESLVLALPALLLFGAVGDVEEIAALTYFQNTLPEGVYGRFFALFMMCTGIGGIVGPIIGPLLTEAFGMGPALALLGIPVIALAAILGIPEGDLRFTGPHFTAHPIADVRDRTQSPS